MSLYLSETGQAEPNESIRAAAAFKVIQAFGNVATWAETRLEESPAEARRLYDMRDRRVREAYDLYESAEYDSLITRMRLLLRAEEEIGLSETQTLEFFEAYDNVSANEARYNKWFNFLYITGSVLLAMGFIRSRLQSSKDA